MEDTRQFTISSVNGNTAVLGNGAVVNNWYGRPDDGRPFAGVPSLPPHFVARLDLSEPLKAALLAGKATTFSTDGRGGTGKTTLATALAYDYQVREHFAGGVLWVGLNEDANTNLDIILSSWAGELGLDSNEVGRLDTPGRIRLLRDQIKQRRLLIVLDDVWHQQHADLLGQVTGPGCAMLLTSRDYAIAQGFGEYNLMVGEMQEQQALALLTGTCPALVQVEAATRKRIVASVGYLPLAISLIAGYLLGRGTRHTVPQADLDDLCTRADTWLALTDKTRKKQIREIIGLSVDVLTTAEQAAFAALAAFAAKPASFSREAAYAVCASDEQTINLLVRRSLLEEAADGRLLLHQVVAAVASERAGTSLSEAQTRHADYYKQYMDANQYKPPAVAREFPQLEQVLAHYHTSGNRRGEATTLTNIGAVYANLGDQQQALRYYEQALPISREVGNRSGEAATLTNIGLVYADLGDKQQALRYYEQALPISREVGDRSGEATTLNNIGGVHFAAGDLQEALPYFEQAVEIAQRVGYAALAEAAEKYLKETRRRLDAGE